MTADSHRAQSTDSYEPRTFVEARTGRVWRGVVGVREGFDTRAVYCVWDGPSFSTGASSIEEALQRARLGIISRGLTLNEGS